MNTTRIANMYFSTFTAFEFSSEIVIIMQMLEEEQNVNILRRKLLRRRFRFILGLLRASRAA